MCISLFKPKFEPVTDLEPVSTKDITIDEVRGIICTRFQPSNNAGNWPNVYLSDASYKTCHYDDVAAFVAQDETNKMGYEAEGRDCDDFAIRLHGQFSIPKWSALCLGHCWTNKHALNCFIDEDGKFWFVEPQSDEIMPELKDWMGEWVWFVEI